MTPSEFRTAKAILQQSDEELAAALSLTSDIIQAWSAGSVSIPRRHAKHIAWLAAGVVREKSLRESGLPECEWVESAFARVEATDDVDEVQKQFEVIEAHGRTCTTCLARERYVAEHFGPMPPPPEPMWARVISAIAGLPPVARPAVLGALLLGALASVRVLFALPALRSNPAKLGQALIAVVAASAAGAFGGVAYTVTRPLRERLGSMGAYLTGVVCVGAYFGALIIVAPIAFGEALVTDQAGFVAVAIASVLFGLAAGHWWFRPERRA